MKFAWANEHLILADQARVGDIEGKTPVAILADENEIVFAFSDKTAVKFYHYQDCCEHVYVDDVNGDWQDLIGVPLLVAEARMSPRMNVEGGSETWTFYTFRSIKGSVDVRWYGESNGCYSEEVDLLPGTWTEEGDRHNILLTPRLTWAILPIIEGACPKKARPFCIPTIARGPAPAKADWIRAWLQGSTRRIKRTCASRSRQVSL